MSNPAKDALADAISAIDALLQQRKIGDGDATYIIQYNAELFELITDMRVGQHIRQQRREVL